MASNIAILAEAPIFHLQLLLDGIFNGSLFALAAYGLTLLWGVTGIKNLAQGELVIMGGYIAYGLSLWGGLHPLWAIVPVMVVMFLFAWPVYFLIRPVIKKNLLTSLLFTFGLAITIQQGLNLIFGSEVQTLESGLSTYSILGNNITVSQIKLVGLGLCALLSLSLIIFMKFSRWGRAIRATAQNPRGAYVLGIHPDKIYLLTFTLNAVICGVAGTLMAMVWMIQPFHGVAHTLRSFVVVTVAGLGNFVFTVMASLGLGVLEQYSGFILGAEFQYISVVTFLLLMLIGRKFQKRRLRQNLQ